MYFILLRKKVCHRFTVLFCLAKWFTAGSRFLFCSSFGGQVRKMFFAEKAERRNIKNETRLVLLRKIDCRRLMVFMESEIATHFLKFYLTSISKRLLQPSTFNLQPSTFNLQPSTFTSSQTSTKPNSYNNANL
jgi:hypothetical protein